MTVSDYSIRRMLSEDIPQVFNIDKNSAALYWPERSYHFEVEQNENSRPWVALNACGAVVGFIVFWLIIDEAHLANFAVLSDYRRQGIGKALLYTALRAAYQEGARVSFLEVRAGNQAALHLYTEAGYQTVSIRKQYYADNHEDALLMNLETQDYCYLNQKISEGEK